MLHSAVNPFLYSFWSKRFRNGIQDYIKKRTRSVNQSITEDSLDHFIKSFNGGQLRGKEAKRVVNRRALKRHFNYELSNAASENKRDAILRRDMVVLHRSESAGITRFKKFGCSLKCKPANKSKIVFNSIAIDNYEKCPKLSEETQEAIKTKNKEKARHSSLRSDTKKLRSQKVNLKRNYKSEGL